MINNSNLVLIYGYNDELESYQYYWAANEPTSLAKEITKSGVVHSVPDVWYEYLKTVKFEIYAIWNDYCNSNLSGEMIDTLMMPYKRKG